MTNTASCFHLLWQWRGCPIQIAPSTFLTGWCPLLVALLGSSNSEWWRGRGGLVYIHGIAGLCTPPHQQKAFKKVFQVSCVGKCVRMFGVRVTEPGEQGARLFVTNGGHFQGLHIFSTCGALLFLAELSHSLSC